MIKCRLIVASCLILLGLNLSCNRVIRSGITAHTIPKTLSWDLSQSHELRDIGWESKAPIDSRLMSKYLEEDGDFDLTVKLSGGRVFHERVHRISITKCNSAIQTLMVATFPMTLNDAQTKGRQFIEYWKFDPKNFDGWCDGRRRGLRAGDEVKFETYQNLVYPSLGLAVPYSFDARKPWFLLFEVTWMNPTGPVECP